MTTSGGSTLESQRSQQQRWQAKMLAEGRCSQCGKAKGDDGNARMCGDCRERNRKAVRRIQKRRRAAGLCVHCDKRPAPGFRSLCEDHRMGIVKGITKCGLCGEKGHNRATCAHREAAE